MIEIDKNKCTGCAACSGICPKKAIVMKENNEGFLYPEIDRTKCINCGLCNKVCPLINKKNHENFSKCYAVQLNDKKMLKCCASGGAFAGIALYILENKGIVYGIAKKNWSLEYTKIEKKENLDKLLGSKYYQCNIKREIFDEIADYTQNRKVLVSGTPCQISAFLNYPKIKKENLITFEIICQGVPSEHVIKKYYLELEKNKKSKLIDHQFRSKDMYVGRNYLNKYTYENGEIEYTKGGDDSLTLSFQRQIYLRHSCYNCQYTNENRIADFTGADLWKYNLKSNGLDFEKGVSALICNTQKANEIFLETKKFKYEEIDKREALKENIPYHHSVKKPFSRKFSYLLLNANLPLKIITMICCPKYYIKKIIKKGGDK